MNPKNPIRIKSDEFRTMITTSLDGFLIVDVTGYILEANDSYCRMVGYTREELISMHISEVDAIESSEDVLKRAEMIVQKGALRFETRHRHKNGSTIDIEVCSNYSSVQGGVFFSTFRDISEHKRTRGIIDARLRLTEGSINHSIEDLLRETLDEAENLTGSCVGFYHFLDSDQEMLTLKAWSTRTAALFCKADAAGSHYNISLAGVWADCVRVRRAVIHNDYASLPDRKGMPDGHAVVVRELVVPVFRKGNIVAILGVGNKPTDYDQSDVDLVTLLADLAYGVVEKKQLDISLSQSEERYRNIVENQTEFVDRYLPGGILTYVNESLVNFAGLPEEKILGTSFYPFLHEADREETIRRIESISIDNPVVETESRIALPDGKIRWSRWIHTGFFDASGNIIEYQSVGRDITERRESKLALAESENRYRTLFHKAGEGICILSQQGVMTQVNDVFAKEHGYEIHEMLGMNIRDLDINGGVDENPERVQAISSGKTIMFEVEHYHKDGSVFPLEVKVSLITLGGESSFICFHRNISERRQAELALQKLSSEMERVLETSSTGLTRCTREFYYLSANSAYAKIAGVPREQIVGKPIVEVLGEKGLATIMPYVERVLNGERVEYETPVLFKAGDGARFLHIVYTPDKDDDGAVIGWVASITDITERKRTEVLLQESEERYRKFSQLTSDFVYRCERSPDEPFRIKWMGGAIEKITGYSQEEVFAKGCWLPWVHPDDRPRISDALLGLVPGETSENEFRIINKSGEICWLLESLLCETGNEPGKYVLFGSAQDITENKRAEEEHQNLERQLQQTQRLESLGVLAGGIAHDFNNILAIIMGHCSLTEMDYKKAPDHIPQIEKAVARAAELCRQMLAYAGKAQFVQAQVNIAELVEEMVKMLRSTIKQNVEIIASIDTDIPSIKADASQIRQIAMNLIINGAEAIGDAQGEVRVLLAKTVIKTGSSKKDYLGKIIPAGWYACLDVTDNGSGMSDETYNRIFEPFYTTKFTGRGLGLSAVLGIVTAQGGALQLLSQLGRGTTFKVYLPLPISDAIAGEVHKPVNQTESWLGSGTVLLVEDEEQILQVAKAMLMELGFNVIEARNGKEALEQYEKSANDINLVVTDMGMPVMDGYALFYELKKRNPALPIIITSGFGEADITSRISRADIAGLVGKPYNFNLLRNVLKSVELKNRFTVVV